MSRMYAWTLVVLCGLTVPAWAQYAGSDESMNNDIRDAGRRALSQDALKQHQDRNVSGSGPSVAVNLVFPPNQTGLSNIETVELVPEGSGAHMCESIAQKQGGNRILATYQPKKDVRRGQSYVVVVSDAAGDKYAVGRIRVSGGGSQTFTISAPLLTPYSPVYNGGPLSVPDQSPDGSRQSMNSSSDDGAAAAYDWRRDRTPDGRRYPGPPLQDGQESRWAKAEFAREASLRPWVLGMKVISVTPYAMAAAGKPGSHLDAVVVYAVMPGSPAAQYGIRKGDVIASVNGHGCATAEQFADDVLSAGDTFDFVMYSRQLGRTVNMHIVGDVRWGQRGHGSGTDHYQPPAVGPGYVPPGTSAYHPPSVGPGYVPPGTSPYHAPTTGPGYVAPGTSAYHAQTTGPGYVPPGQGGGSQGKASNQTNGPATGWQQQQTHVNPLPPGSSNFQSPTTGPGYVAPGQTPSNQQAGKGQHKKTHPSSNGSSGYQAPTTGPGYKPPGG